MLFSGTKHHKKGRLVGFPEYVNDNRTEASLSTAIKNCRSKVRSESVNYVFGEEAGRFGANPFIQVNIPSTQGTSEFLDTVKKEKAYDIKVRFDTTSEIWGMLLTFAPFLLIIVFWIWMMRRMQGGPGGGGGGIFSVGKSKAQLFDKDAGPKVTFKDVAGLSEARGCSGIVEFLKHPGNYTNLGGNS